MRCQNDILTYANDYCVPKYNIISAEMNSWETAVKIRSSRRTATAVRNLIGSICDAGKSGATRKNICCEFNGMTAAIQ